MGSSQGKFLWYELATSDVAAATKFYKDVIGWGTDVFEGAGMPYTRWTADGVAIGGMMLLAEQAKKNGAPPHWMAYVCANDVDALTDKARSLGGTSCVPPTDIPNVGRFSVIADPQGAVLALMTPKGPEVPQAAEVPLRHVSWHELLTDDQEAAFRFYSSLFGWQKTDAVEMPTGLYQMYGREGRTLGGIMKMPKEAPGRPHWLYYVRVEDLDGALARVRRGGGRVENGPIVVPGGSRVAQCLDPQGAAFALHGQ